jgi:hypothetical protein
MRQLSPNFDKVNQEIVLGHYHFEDYRWKSGVAIWILDLMSTGKKVPLQSFVTRLSIPSSS